MLRKILSNPTTEIMDIDLPETTNLRKQIIENKPFLKDIYLDWYRLLLNQIPDDDTGEVCELGSGGGYLKSIRPDIITSDVLTINNVDVVFDGCSMPFRYQELKALVMINVLHHLSRPRQFFREASRCLVDEGVIAFIEPWPTAWSRLIYTRLHHEPFLPDAVDWEFEQSGPLSGANGALPWIIFRRDLRLFEAEFPEFKLLSINEHTPFRYLLSGGVSLRSLTPAWTSNFWRKFENLVSPLGSFIAMFALIVLRKKV